MIHVTVHGNTVVFDVRVAPRASRDSIEGKIQGALKIRLTAPPVDNRANDSLRRLADRLNLPASAVRIVRAESSRIKRVEVLGATQQQIEALA